MDNTGDSTISFDENGRCSYCSKAEKDMPNIYFPNAEGEYKLQQMIEMLKKEYRDFI